MYCHRPALLWDRNSASASRRSTPAAAPRNGGGGRSGRPTGNTRRPEPSKIPYRNSATMAAEALRQSARPTRPRTRPLAPRRAGSRRGGKGSGASHVPIQRGRPFSANAAMPEEALDRGVTGRCQHGTVAACILQRKTMNDLPPRPAADLGTVEDRFFTLRDFPLTDGTVMPRRRSPTRPMAGSRPTAATPSCARMATPPVTISPAATRRTATSRARGMA